MFSFKSEKIAYEKISDKDKRQLKVNQLKEKIRSELESMRKNEIKILNTFGIDKECILNLFALYAIEDFINNPNVFMNFSSIYKDEDIIFYQTHIYYINLMLEDKFNFCQTILTKLKSQDDGFYYIGSFMYEKNLIHNIISIVYEMIYDDSKNDNTNIK